MFKNIVISFSFIASTYVIQKAELYKYFILATDPHRHTQTNSFLRPDLASKNFAKRCSFRSDKTCRGVALAKMGLPRRSHSEDGSSERKIPAGKCSKHFTACPVAPRGNPGFKTGRWYWGLSV